MQWITKKDRDVEVGIVRWRGRNQEVKVVYSDCGFRRSACQRHSGSVSFLSSGAICQWTYLLETDWGEVRVVERRGLREKRGKRGKRGCSICLSVSSVPQRNRQGPKEWDEVILEDRDRQRWGGASPLRGGDRAREIWIMDGIAISAVLLFTHRPYYRCDVNLKNWLIILHWLPRRCERTAVVLKYVTPDLIFFCLSTRGVPCAVALYPL